MRTRRYLRRRAGLRRSLQEALREEDLLLQAGRLQTRLQTGLLQARLQAGRSVRSSVLLQARPLRRSLRRAGSVRSGRSLRSRLLSYAKLIALSET